MKIAQYYSGKQTRLGLIKGNQLFPVHFKGDMIDFIRSGTEVKISGNPTPIALKNMLWRECSVTHVRMM